MPVKVAVVAQAQPELDAIRYELRNPVRFMIREFLTLEEVKAGLGEFGFQILLLRIHQFGSANVAMLLKIRAHYPNVAIILLAREIDPSARFQIRAMPGTKVIHEETELPDLQLIIEQLARGDHHPSRLHARVRRESAAEIVDVKENLRMPARFLDFAQMGARVVVTSKRPLKKNDRFQVHYESTSEPGKIHRIEAVVIWQQITSGMVGTIFGGPQQTVGVRFIAAL